MNQRETLRHHPAGTPERRAASVLSGLWQRSRQREIERWKELVAAEGQLR